MSTIEILLTAGTLLALLLHYVAHKTKNTVDDRVADALDELLALVKGGAGE